MSEILVDESASAVYSNYEINKMKLMKDKIEGLLGILLRGCKRITLSYSSSLSFLE